MWDFLEATLPYRFAAGVTFFGTLGLIDYWRNRENPRSAKEYLFLLYAMCVAVVYAVVHDQITVTISADYFLFFKGLADDPHQLRVAAIILAVKASYGVGLLGGACLLLANNPVPDRPQLEYRYLMRLAWLPVVMAIVGAVTVGALFSIDTFSMRSQAHEFTAAGDTTPFLIVWGIHIGSYLGGALGIVTAVWQTRRLRAAGRISYK